jgi:hypothetical protein
MAVGEKEYTEPFTVPAQHVSLAFALRSLLIVLFAVVNGSLFLGA